MYAFVNLNNGAGNPVRVRLDQIAAVTWATDGLGGVCVTLLSGTVVKGNRSPDVVWDAMLDLADRLAEEDGA